ncbi:MAG TPA: 5-oxoprolinase subunit PxpB [Rhodanobacteraceae bacterium]
MARDYSLEPLSETALLVRFGNRIDAGVSARVHAAAAALRAAAIAGISDVAPAYASLLVGFEPGALAVVGNADGYATLLEALRACLDALPPATASALGRPSATGIPDAATPTHKVEIPVCYGGACGPDLVAVAAHAGLSTADVIARHSAGAYTVAMLGFAPGFAYLLGLDSALDTPRRATPRVRVPAGSVAIGGAQTGIYPSELPGGWNVIGRTPLTLFDARRDAPALLGPGDRVRFRAIAADEFARLAVPRA